MYERVLCNCFYSILFWLFVVVLEERLGGLIKVRVVFMKVRFKNIYNFEFWLVVICVEVYVGNKKEVELFMVKVF